MFTYCSDFIGYPENLRNSEFHGVSDSITKYHQSIKTLGTDWEYAKIKFNYVRNSLGHRSKDISQLDTKNYILCTGCSITEGIGIPVEDRYSNLLSSKLGCDLYNLGLGGTGNDVIFYNLVNWFSSIEHKPKLVIIQWTANIRFSTEKNNVIYTHGTWEEKNIEFMDLGEKLNYFQSKTNFHKKLIYKMIDVPILELYAINKLDNETTNQDEFIFPPDKYIDYARDRMHPGRETNKHYADTIYDYIQKVKLL